MKVSKEQLQEMIKEALKYDPPSIGSGKGFTSGKDAIKKRNFAIMKANAKSAVAHLNKVKDSLQEIFEDEATWRPLEKALDQVMMRIIKKHNGLETDPGKHFTSIKLKEEKKS
jgi:hypothetical protein